MVRVYIVEDHRMIREMLRTSLELEAEIEVVGDAPEAEQALTDLKSKDVDVVLMDIGLPGMNGVDATRRLSEIRPELPVVILTSFQNDNVELAIQAGARGYILKTSPGEELTRAIHAVHKGEAFIDQSLTGRLFQRVSQPARVGGESVLTARQLEILELVADGVRYADVADRLAVSETTVTRDMRAIFHRMGVTAIHERGELHDSTKAPEGPELSPEFWDKAAVVMPVEKKSIHLRVDSDVLDFFKHGGKGHLTRINAVLRSYMEAQKSKVSPKQ